MSNFFSFKLYKEGLAQLRFLGFLTSGIALVFAALVPIMAFLQDFHFARAVDADEVLLILTVLLPYIWVAPFILTFSLFGFLNSRKKSDFYHALSVKRTALFASFSTAVATWLIATALLIIAVGTALFLALNSPLASGSTPVDVLLISLTLFASSALALLFATSVAAFAASMSGTRFTSLTVAVLVLALPPLLKSIFAAGVANNVPSLSSGDVFVLGQNLFYFMPFEDAFTVTNILYTLAYAVVLMVAAGIFFARRKSEAAGDSAISPWLQWVFRIAVGFLPLVIAYNAFFGFDAIVWIVVTITVALVLMCVFELISTNKWKNLLYVMPAFAISIVAMLAFVTLIWAVATIEADFSPQTEEISSVQILDSDYNYVFWSSAVEMSAISALEQRETQIQDPRVIALAVNQLEEIATTPRWGHPGEEPDWWTIYVYVQINMENGRTENRIIPVGTVRDEWIENPEPFDEEDDDMGAFFHDEWRQVPTFNDFGTALAEYARTGQ